MSRRFPSVVLLALVAAIGATPARAEEPRGSDTARTLAYAGRVVDPEGKPVAGAVVHAITGPPPQVMVHSALLPWRDLVRALPAEPVGGSRLATAPSPTGPDGAFRIEGIPPPVSGHVVVV